MTLRDAVELWEIATGKQGTEYLNDCEINADIDRDALWDYLMFEFMDMKIIDSDSQFFHERVKNFFKIHKWNIDELVKTLSYEYEPLDNTRWKQEEDVTEHNTRDRDDNWQRDEKIATNDNWQRDYGEKGSSYEQDVNLISAYNDETSPHVVGKDENGNNIYEYNDEEHDRTVINKNYSLNGNENKKEQIDQTQGETKKEQEDIVDNKRKDHDTLRSGNDGTSFQSLIEEQRESVQFNIYKWIAKHFSKELLIAVW